MSDDSDRKEGKVINIIYQEWKWNITFKKLNYENICLNIWQLLRNELLPRNT